MTEIRFHLAISAEEYLKYYQGTINSVQVSLHDGRVIQFPVVALQKYVTRSGVHGSFRIVFDQNNKLQSIERVTN